ncbi:MAG TPA: serine/threonine-protein kinase, partial [Polyangiaceae bacterium]|nr:serine/threonine-protein kinase [Polyangiaceae bacterium]
KFLRPELATEVELIRQFTREGRVLAKLSHPHVVQVFAMYSLDGIPCLAMEYLEGKSLTELVREAGGRLTSEQALELLLEAARGLTAAHELGLLHRDIKPDNLFVVEASRGRARCLKLIDFGLATADRARPQALLDDPSLDSNAVGGTPLFLAPELWNGQSASPKTDLYALGVSFYFALSGAYPSGPLGIRGLMEYAKAGDPAPRLRDARADVLPGLAGLVDRLIAKDPSERPESAAALAPELIALGDASRPRRVPGTGPFRGLMPYSENERDVFFARDAEIAEVSERLRAESGVCLVGPAACGKTSLALAGVLPLIRGGILGGGIRFLVAVVEPTRRPLAALCAAIASALGGAEDELQAAFEQGAGSALELIKRRLAGGAGLLLIVDQLEQLPRLAEHAGEAARFAEILARLAEIAAPEIKVLCCLRADALDRLMSLGGLKSFFARGFVPVPVLGAQAIHDGVKRALEVAGYGVDDEEALAVLVGQLSELRYGTLLLGLTLASLWRDRDEAKRLLKLRDFTARGGFVAALVAHADAVVKALAEKQCAIAEDVLTQFVSADRRPQRALGSSLLAWRADAEGVLSLLVESRLLIEIADELELVHPALIERWSFLKAAIESRGDDRVLYERVAAAARDWDAQGRPEGALWHGEQADRLV